MSEHEQEPQADLETGYVAPQPPAEQPEEDAESEPESEPERGAPQTAPEEQPARIWDPVAQRWVSEHEIATAPPRPGAGADRPSMPTPARTAAGAPAAAGTVPHWVSALVAGVAGAVLAVVAMLFVPGVIGRPPREVRPAQSDLTEPAASDTADMVARARPWVAGISASGSVPTLLGTQPFKRSGSGVVVREDGAIAVPARLVDGADKIQVTLATGRIVEGDVLGADGPSDIAVVRVDERDLVPAIQGTSEALALGDPVVAISAPAGLSTVVTTGAISAMGQVATAEGLTLFDLLRVDAPLTSGGSGGVVVGRSNAAVGMTASFGDGTTGYAIPIDIVRSVSEQILDGRKPSHPWVGVTVETTDADEGPALVVSAVFKGSPAESAAIKPGDLIVGIDGGAPQGPLTLLKKVLDHRVGDDITLTLRRNGSTQTVKVKVEERSSGG